MSTLETTHEKEKSEKGWSELEILGYGADHSLFPEYGKLIVADPQSTDKDIEAGQAFIRAGDDEPDEVFLTNGIDKELLDNFYAEVADKVQFAMGWLLTNPEKAFSYKDSSGRAFLNVIGEALVCLGEKTMSYPPTGKYSADSTSDAGFYAWKSDLVKYGSMLATSDVSSWDELMEWWGSFYHHFWS